MRQRLECGQQTSAQYLQSQQHCGVTIVATDDPRWTAACVRYNEAVLKADALALEMLDVPPVSLAGVAALLTYAAEFVEEGNLWPEAVVGDDDDIGRDWQHCALLNAAAATRQLIAVAS